MSFSDKKHRVNMHSYADLQMFSVEMSNDGSSFQLSIIDYSLSVIFFQSLPVDLGNEILGICATYVCKSAIFRCALAIYASGMTGKIFLAIFILMLANTNQYFQFQRQWVMSGKQILDHNVFHILCRNYHFNQ